MSGNYQVPGVGPKNQQLLDLERLLYGLNKSVTDELTRPGGYQRVTYNRPDGSLAEVHGNFSTPFEYMDESEKSPFQRAIADAFTKEKQANERYGKLPGEADWYRTQSNDALRQSGDALEQAKTAGDKYFSQADTSFADARNFYNEGAGYMRKAGTAGDEWYERAKGAYGKAEGMAEEDRAFMRKTGETNKWYDDYSRRMLGGAENLLSTGNIPAPLLEAMRGNIKTGLDQSMGAGLNDWASRGVINSSVATQGLNNMSNAAGDALQRGYMDAFNSILDGYNLSAGTAANAGKAFTEAMMQIAEGLNVNTGNMIKLGDSYSDTGHNRVTDFVNVGRGFSDLSNSASTNAANLMKAGSDRISDWRGISQGYGDLSGNYLKGLDTNIKERDFLSKAPEQYWKNAWAPVKNQQDFLHNMQQDHWNSNKQDTVVPQGGGGGKCFVTTAVCEYFGKPDDCYELTTLRQFRDEWLRKQPDGEELVKMYYDIAPRVVEKLKNAPNRDEIYAELLEDHIRVCLSHIENGENEKCKEHYVAMIHYLKDAVSEVKTGGETDGSLL